MLQKYNQAHFIPRKAATNVTKTAPGRHPLQGAQLQIQQKVQPSASPQGLQPQMHKNASKRLPRQQPQKQSKCNQKMQASAPPRKATTNATKNSSRRPPPKDSNHNSKHNLTPNASNRTKGMILY